MQNKEGVNVTFPRCQKCGDTLKAVRYDFGGSDLLVFEEGKGYDEQPSSKVENARRYRCPRCNTPLTKGQEEFVKANKK